MNKLNFTLLFCIVSSFAFGQLNLQFNPIPSSIITSTSPNPVYTLDVPYGVENLQEFDVFLPDTTGTFPLVVFIHGGGFTGGDKATIYGSRQQDLIYFLDNGIACISINYRLLPGPSDPAHGTETEGVIKCLNDAKYALQYIRYYATDLHIDPDKVVVYGTSAGAGTSLWLATRENMADLTSSDPVEHMSTRVCAALAINTQSTYDLYRWESDVYDNFDGNGTNFTLDSIEPLLGFDRYNDFYGGIIDSTYDVLYDPVLIQYRQDVDMFYHLDANDPPLYINSANSSSHPSQDPLHHYLHSVTLNEMATTAGLSEVKANITTSGINTTGGESYLDFLQRHLNSCTLSTISIDMVEESESNTSIFPNPVNETLYIQSDLEQPAYIIYDIMGTTVRQGQGNEVDLSELQGGLYFIQIANRTFKFIRA